MDESSKGSKRKWTWITRVGDLTRCDIDKSIVKPWQHGGTWFRRWKPGIDKKSKHQRRKTRSTWMCYHNLDWCFDALWARDSDHLLCERGRRGAMIGSSVRGGRGENVTLVMDNRSWCMEKNRTFLFFGTSEYSPNMEVDVPKSEGSKNFKVRTTHERRAWVELAASNCAHRP